jgi:poly(ADP-ribose) glycohydrolase ARH3
VTADAAVGALLGTFAGDAIGRPWEGSSPASGRSARDRLTWLDGERVLTYTDDTQLALALAAHLVDHPAVDPDALVAYFLAAYEDHRGYGAGMRRLVAHWRDGMPWGPAATSVFPDGSFGNGAAMRVAPVGARWRNDADVRDDAVRRSAIVTHAHPVGIDGAVVQAEAVAAAARRGAVDRDVLAAAIEAARTAQLREPLARAATWVDRWSRGEGDFAAVAADLGTAVTADRSVPAALFCAAVADDLVGAVEVALGLGGDADTIAAMAASIHGAAVGRSAVPHDWLVRFEDGDRGVTHAIALGERLDGAG